MNRVELRPFERQRLLLVEPWFTDGDTRRWLGGPAWPRQMLDLADRPLGEFRGAAETGRYRWLAWDQGTAVGYIDCGTCDRWTTWEGGPGGRGVIEAIPIPAASISYVVDPALRRRGYCAAMVEAVMTRPERAASSCSPPAWSPPMPARPAACARPGSTRGTPSPTGRGLSTTCGSKILQPARTVPANPLSPGVTGHRRTPITLSYEEDGENARGAAQSGRPADPMTVSPVSVHICAICARWSWLPRARRYGDDAGQRDHARVEG
jgi:RimJ/RimL family protein N-acetyltransferase